ncbi:MAG: phenylalanine--tRNA ligase subunit beta, partial [bacterium]|nr:phenylalanine--tRNA ligase subunit beta [bacterium]
YRRGEGGSDFIEREWCGLVLWGAATEQGIWAGERKCDVHDAKGVLEVVLDRLGVKGIAFEAGEREGWHPGRTAVVKETSRGKELGWVGELHPRVVREWDISGPVAVAELDVEVIAEVRVSEKRYVRLPRFPAATRDVAIVVPARVSHAEVMGVIRRCGGPLLRDVTIFDRYQGEQIPAGCVSMAYHIEYRSEERTLTDEEVDMAHAALVAALEAELGAQVRA